MRKIVVGILLIMLCGCKVNENNVYVVGVGLERKDTDHIYMVIIDGKGEDEFHVMEETDQSVREAIRNLEEKYNIHFDLRTLRFIISNTEDITWIEEFMKEYTIEYDCYYALSNSITEIFNTESKTLIDDILGCFKEDEILWRQLRQDKENTMKYIISDGEEIYTDENRHNLK